MDFTNKEGRAVSIDGEEWRGHTVKLESGTSTFSGKTLPGQKDLTGDGNILDSFKEAGYDLIGDNFITIDTAQSRQNVLAEMSPRLRAQLVFPEELAPRDLYENSYVILIVDNDHHSLVDWVFPKPMAHTALFINPDLHNLSLDFDIPLVPVSREKASMENNNFIQSISQWGSSQQLTFGVFSFRNEVPLNQYFFHPDVDFLRFVPHNFIDRVSDLILKADRFIKKETHEEEMLQIIQRDGKTREATSQDFQNTKTTGTDRVLLFCHGIISSTHAGFDGLLKDSKYFPALYDKFDKVFAWDHYTLSRTTAENAAELSERLAGLHDAEVNIICHSRGASVIRNFLENPDITKTLYNRNIQFNKVVFVAGACLGSQLADPKHTNRLFRRLNMLTWFAGGVVPAFFLSAILTLVKLMATIAQRIPGTVVLNPAGDEIATLNSYGNTLAKEYHYIRANFDFTFLPTKLLEEYFVDGGVFEHKANDLIVPYEGAGSSNKYLSNAPVSKKDDLQYGNANRGQSKVWHITFFKQDKTKQELINLF